MIAGAIDTGQTVFLVAEIGNNHEGKVERARELVARARDCGAHAVKFQTFRTELFQSKLDSARFARLKSFELSFAQFEELAVLAKKSGLLFMSTPLDLESARFLTPLVDVFKIASGDNDFIGLLELVADAGKPTIVSTGASDLGQVERAVAVVKQRWAARRGPEQTAASAPTGAGPGEGQLGILHCVTSYPAPPEQVNLAAIETLRRVFPRETIGYSDHTMGLDAALAAVALGARIVEKHFTLDHHQSDFRDHQLSADPAELTELARRLPQVAALRGLPEKVVQPCERPLIPFVRRSAFAARDLSAGAAVRTEDIVWLRPGEGIGPADQHRLVGRKLRRALAAGELFRGADVE
jgi:N,N'-diacetyllegionaminate synthase